jgi:hypothetical protein
LNIALIWTQTNPGVGYILGLPCDKDTLTVLISQGDRQLKLQGSVQYN